MWGAFRQVRGGLFAALVLSVALALTRPLNGIPYRHLSQFVSLANGWAYFFMAGATVGAIRQSLDRAARAVQAAVDRVLLEQDRAAREHARAAQLTVRLDMRGDPARRGRAGSRVAAAPPASARRAASRR